MVIILYTVGGDEIVRIFSDITRAKVEALETAMAQYWWGEHEVDDEGENYWSGDSSVSVTEWEVY